MGVSQAAGMVERPFPSEKSVCPQVPGPEQQDEETVMGMEGILRQQGRDDLLNEA